MLAEGKATVLIQPTLPYEEPAERGFVPGQRRVEQLLNVLFRARTVVFSCSKANVEADVCPSFLPPDSCCLGFRGGEGGGRQPLALRLLSAPASPPSLFKAKVALSCSRCCAPEQYE